MSTRYRANPPYGAACAAGDGNINWDILWDDRIDRRELLKSCVFGMREARTIAHDEPARVCRKSAENYENRDVRPRQKAANLFRPQ